MSKLLKCLAWVVSIFYFLCIVIACFAPSSQDVVWLARLPLLLAGVIVSLIIFSILFSIGKILELVKQCRATQLETEALLREMRAAQLSSATLAISPDSISAACAKSEAVDGAPDGKD